MGDKKWRDELDLVIERNLNEIILATKDYDYAISKAKDKSKAQIWVAIALLNEKLNRLNFEKNGESSKKLEKKEIEDIISKLENY